MESKSLGVGYYRVNTAEVVAKRVSSTLGTPETVRLCSQKLSPRVCSTIACCSSPLSLSSAWVGALQ